MDDTSASPNLLALHSQAVALDTKGIIHHLAQILETLAPELQNMTNDTHAKLFQLACTFVQPMTELYHLDGEDYLTELGRTFTNLLGSTFPVWSPILMSSQNAVLGFMTNMDGLDERSAREKAEGSL